MKPGTSPRGLSTGKGKPSTPAADTTISSWGNFRLLLLTVFLFGMAVAATINLEVTFLAMPLFTNALIAMGALSLALTFGYLWAGAEIMPNWEQSDRKLAAASVAADGDVLADDTKSTDQPRFGWVNGWGVLTTLPVGLLAGGAFAVLTQLSIISASPVIAMAFITGLFFVQIAVTLMAHSIREDAHSKRQVRLAAVQNKAESASTPSVFSPSAPESYSSGVAENKAAPAPRTAAEATTAGESTADSAASAEDQVTNFQDGRFDKLRLSYVEAAYTSQATYIDMLTKEFGVLSARRAAKSLCTAGPIDSGFLESCFAAIQSEDLGCLRDATIDTGSLVPATSTDNDPLYRLLEENRSYIQAEFLGEVTYFHDKHEALLKAAACARDYEHAEEITRFFDGLASSQDLTWATVHNAMEKAVNGLSYCKKDYLSDANAAYLLLNSPTRSRHIAPEIEIEIIRLVAQGFIHPSRATEAGSQIPQLLAMTAKEYHSALYEAIRAKGQIEAPAASTAGAGAGAGANVTVRETQVEGDVPAASSPVPSQPTTPTSVATGTDSNASDSASADVSPEPTPAGSQPDGTATPPHSLSPSPPVPATPDATPGDSGNGQGHATDESAAASGTSPSS